jgi:small ligand-binding sensory domain FIST
MRDTLAAEREMKQTVHQAGARLGTSPDFAMLFPCMGRGPHFYGNRDRDLEILQAAYPGLPTIGFYGNGEIGPLETDNHLFQYSTILGLFSVDT